MPAPRGFTPKEGCCNQPVDVPGGVRPRYCHRPDNGSGMCNVHEAAKSRGEARRRDASELRKLTGVARRAALKRGRRT